MKDGARLETPPSYVETVGPSRNRPFEARSDPEPVSTPTFSQQNHGQSMTSPISQGRASTSSDSSSTRGSFALWGRKKGKERERVQEKEDTSAERKEYERRQSKHGAALLEAEVSWYLSRIPPEAQKALAPLTVSTDSKDIVGSYSIELSSSISYAQAANGTTAVSPTCLFTSTAKHDIDVTLYFRPPPALQANSGRPPLPPRGQDDVPLEILANAKKGKIKLTIPHRLPGRPLRVICSLESNAYLYLPPEFEGKLAIWAPQGTIELSEPLRRNSTIIPSTSNNAYITVYKITPGQTAVDGKVAKELSTNLMDLAQVNTSKGRVKVEYARAGGESCVVM